jgi:hypothetical protein
VRTSDDCLRCARCTSAIRIVLTFPAWIQKATTYIEKIAAAEGWDLEARVCPACKGKS